MTERVRNPIISGNPRERTGSNGILRRSLAEINRRWRGLQVDVLAVFARIPVYQLNEDDKGSDTPTLKPVSYGATPQVLNQTTADLQAALDRWVTDGRQVDHVAWWDVYSQEAAQLGTAQTVANLTQLSASYAATRTLQTVVFSQPYRNRSDIARTLAREHWTGLSSKSRTDLAGVIGRAVVDGKNPKAVRTEIMQVLDVSRSRAALYAQTEITGTLREARWAEADAAEAELGIKTALLWTSALIPTTRAWHASRNGKTFSTAEVRAFYATNGNRYRCYLPGTLVAGRFVAGAKSRYKGPAVRLVTAGGRELAVTANHPVMTSRGLVAAAEIRKGDNLIAYLGEQEGAARVVDLDRELVGARIEDVFGALVESGHKRLARVGRVDFHGDAAFMQPDIEVVNADLVLTVAMDASLAQLLDELSFVHPDSPAAGRRALEFLGRENGAHAGHGIGRESISLALCEGELAHPVCLSCTAAAPVQPGVIQPARDSTTGDANALADREDGLAGQVGSMQIGGQRCASTACPCIPAETDAMESLHQCTLSDANAVRDVLEGFASFAAFDEVVDVVWSEYDGHVFDLQELSGLMLGSGIVASNCHCAQTEALLDADGKPILSKSLQSAMANEKKAWQSRQKTGAS